MNRYTFCGWHLASSLPLPEFSQTPSEIEPDIVVRETEYPAAIDGWVQISPYLWIDARQNARLHIPGIACYDIYGGKEVVISLERGADVTAVRLFLLESVLGILAHQRGVIPLLASSFQYQDRAIIVGGSPVSGKSTIAFMLARRGYSLLAENITFLKVGLDGAFVLPSSPRYVRIWRDVADAFRLPVEELSPVRQHLGKYNWPVPEAPGKTAPALPIGKILLLRSGEFARVDAPSSNAPMVNGLMHIVDHLHFARRAKLGKKLWLKANLIAKRVKIDPIWVERTFENIEHEMDMLLSASAT